MNTLIITKEAKEYEDHSLKELRAAGFRITMPRVQVIRALADTNHALSAYAIHQKILDFNGKIDVVSVYRILSTLQEVGLIHHIGVVDGYFPCKIANSGSKRSAVLVSQADQTVQELDLTPALIDSIEALASKSGYATTQIKVEIVGTKSKGKK